MSEESIVQVVRLASPMVHPNADKLEIWEVDGRPCIASKGQFQPGDLGVYVPVDTLVPVDRPEFEFLLPRSGGKPMYRVRAMRLRGSFSMGLLLKPRGGMKVGQDVGHDFGCVKYLPPSEREPTERKGPSKRSLRAAERVSIIRHGLLRSAAVGGALGFANPWLGVAAGALGMAVTWWRTRTVKLPAVGYYDIESLRKYSRIFEEGEHVSVEEKLHGCHAAYTVIRGKMHAFSRTTWRNNDKASVWWRIGEMYGCHRVPEGCTLRGEIVGPGVQDLTYGGVLDFYVFDMQDFSTREYWPRSKLHRWCLDHGLKMVPELYRGPYSRRYMDELAEGKSELANHVREGVVIRPLSDETSLTFGRRILKLVGQGYLLRDEK